MMPALTELEERLAGPDAQRVCNELLEALEAQEAQFRSAIRMSLPRDEFAIASALLDATVAAREVLQQWRQRKRPREPQRLFTPHPPGVRHVQ